MPAQRLGGRLPLSPLVLLRNVVEQHRQREERLRAELALMAEQLKQARNAMAADRAAARSQILHLEQALGDQQQLMRERQMKS